MTDINDVMPKIPSMKWGALMNRAPTNGKVEELNRIFPHNGKWHTVFEEKDHTYIDDKLVWKKEKKLGHKLIFYDQSYIHLISMSWSCFYQPPILFKK